MCRERPTHASPYLIVLLNEISESFVLKFGSNRNDPGPAIAADLYGFDRKKKLRSLQRAGRADAEGGKGERVWKNATRMPTVLGSVFKKNNINRK